MFAKIFDRQLCTIQKMFFAFFQNESCANCSWTQLDRKVSCPQKKEEREGEGERKSAFSPPTNWQKLIFEPKA